MKKQLTKPILLIATIALLFSCGEDNSPSLVQNEFLGTWIEKDPEYFDGINDTIVFQENGLIGKHHFFNSYQYQFIDDSLKITGELFPRGFFKYPLTIISENEIIIGNFLTREISSYIKNVPYIKLQEPTK